MSGKKQRFKIVLLGEGRVGKTSIVVRYVKQKYDARMESTLQASFLKKQIVVDGTTVLLNIWDTAGQERFHALGPIYYRDADGALLVYDITYGDSLKRVKEWVKELRKMDRNIPIAIAGNKIDLEKNRHVPEKEAIGYARSINAIHVHTSAKQGKGLDEIFNELTKAIFAKNSSSGSRRSGKPSITILDEDDDDILGDGNGNGKKGCC
jgi:Ras-related protein Rab-21